ncbi:MAG TPA: DUF2298 domain-containing protein [Candidatus Eremiobacteraeota bacterium]|nr:DUF2298 domain-containing protein [Candidatus Eremiobacteraeota bacterium]
MYRKIFIVLIFIFILIVGAFLRFQGLDWDEEQHLHPDERFLTMVETSLLWPASIGEYMNESKSPLNPRNMGHSFFVYGSLPITIVKAAGLTLKYNDYNNIYLVGRALSGLFDIGSIVFLFLTARVLYRDNRIALLACFFLSTAVLPIQHSHFFVVDTFANFFTVATLYFLALFQTQGKLFNILMSGIFFGMAMACKISIFTMVFVIIIVVLYRVFIAEKDKKENKILKVINLLALSGFICFIVFRITVPDAFQGILTPAGRWLANLGQVRHMMNGDIDFPPGHQWTNRTPIIFPWINMVFWGMGIPLGLTVWIGWLIAGYRLYKKEYFHLIPWAWTIILFLHQSTQWVKTARYFLPIYPVLILLGAWFLISLWDRKVKRKLKSLKNNFISDLSTEKKSILSFLQRSVVTVLIFSVIIGTLLWAIAFSSIYRRPHTRIQATQWICENIPPGSTLSNEPWDDPLPLRIKGEDLFFTRYTGQEMKWYDNDTPEKLQKSLIWLDRTDYIILSSNRACDSIPRLPMRYPMTIKYYNSLFDGSLGFKKIAEFTSYPEIFGLKFPDDNAEEAFSVYDHPKVRIFKKTPFYNHEKALLILGNTNWDEIVLFTPKMATKAPTALFFSSTLWEKYKKEGTWSEIFKRSSIVNKIPVLIWVIVLEILGLISAPYLFVVCRNLPDRGYSIAKITGLLLAGWSIWLLASFHILSFNRTGIILVVFFIVIISLLLCIIKWRDFSTFWKRNKNLLLIEEGIFWIFFITFLMIRWANPDLWHPAMGGEKPMDFAYLNGVIKSSWFPPYNPWFSKGYLNYYYFGFVLIGTIIKVTGILPRIAYNLAIPTLFAMTATGAFGATLALINKDIKSIKGKDMAISLLGPLFVCVTGNLGEIKLIIQGLSILSDQAGKSLIPVVFKVFHGFILLLKGHTLPIRNEWWYWNATRVISYESSEAVPITEFPWFTYLYGDLHAHAMGLPLTIVVIVLIIAIIRSTRITPFLICFIALFTGALWPTNTWDVPTYSFLFFVALLIRYQGKEKNLYNIIKKSLFLWIITIITSYILYLPYHISYIPGYNSFELWRGSKTPLSDYLTIHGLFLFSIITALLIDFCYGKNHNKLIKFIKILLRKWHKLNRFIKLYDLLVKPSPIFHLYLIITFLFFLLGLIITVFINPLTGLSIWILILTVLLIFRPEPEPTWQMTITFAGIGVFLSCLVEYIVLKGDISRMNTVFKFYFQIWVLFGLASVKGLKLIIENSEKYVKYYRKLWLSLFIFLFILTMLYPLCSTRGKIRDRFDSTAGNTLDGMAYMNKSIYNIKDQEFSLLWDKLAIEWMEDNIKGSPVIAEINTTPDLYSWGNRYSIYTGLPCVIGWDWHQRQQRPLVSELVSKRIENIQYMYSTPEPEMAYKILYLYEVDYLIVGPLEKIYSTPEGIAKFEGMNGIYWDLLYKNPEVQIYKIKRDLKDLTPLVEPPPIPTPTPATDYFSLPPVDPFVGGQGKNPGNFNEPRDLVIDNQDNIYIVDFRNHRIQKFDSSGNFLKGWGEKGKNHKEFDDPSGIGINNKTGEILIADTWNHRVQKFDSSGNFLLSIEKDFYGPRDVAIDSEDNIYICDTGNSEIKKFNSSGKFLLSWGGHGEGTSELLNPWGIAVSKDNEIYITDCGQKKIKIFSSMGQFLREWNLSAYLEKNSEEMQICIEKEDIIVCDNINCIIMKFNKKGTLLKQLNVLTPTGVAVTSGGELIYSEHDYHRLKILLNWTHE